MGFLSDLFDHAAKKAGCDDATRAKMAPMSDSELGFAVRNRTGQERINAFVELKRRYGTAEANERVRRG